MTINHHPTLETLVELATGRLDVGRTIVVSAHLESCPHCTRQISRMQTVGGCLLAAAAPVAVGADALSRAFAAIDLLEHEPPDHAMPLPSPPADVPFLPRAVLPYRLGDWQWIGPGIHRRMLELPEDSGARVFLLRAAPGTRMPEHTHTGTELTLVLRGAFGHAGGRFGSGDFDEADETVDHQPIVETGETCVCLVAMQGALKLTGITGRLLQPFVRL